jgi:hypothetical protein
VQASGNVLPVINSTSSGTAAVSYQANAAEKYQAGYNVGGQANYAIYNDATAKIDFMANTDDWIWLGTLGTGALFQGATSGTTKLAASATASGTLTLPAATDQLVARATTDTLTNKTYDTAGTGNVFKINGTQITGTGGSTATVTSDIASGTAAMTTAAITAGNCGATVTVAASGVLTTDAITWSFNAAPAGSNAGLVSWPTANNVNFAYCPNSAETPAAATINWRVVR